MGLYRHVPSQIVICILFQVVMWVDFKFTSYTLLGAYVLSYVFCLLWGNVGYLLLSDAVFCLLTVWFIQPDDPAVTIDLCFWYLLFTLVPGMLIVSFRNAWMSRYWAR